MVGGPLVGVEMHGEPHRTVAATPYQVLLQHIAGDGGCGIFICSGQVLFLEFVGFFDARRYFLAAITLYSDPQRGRGSCLPK